jgi:hypothetical protein
MISYTTKIVGVKTAPTALPSRIHALARPAARHPCLTIAYGSFDACASTGRFAPLITPPFGGYWFALLTVNTKLAWCSLFELWSHSNNIAIATIG